MSASRVIIKLEEFLIDLKLKYATLMPTGLPQEDICRHARIAVGFMEAAKALIGAAAPEMDLRMGFSRLYYAFYHIAVALALTSDAQRLTLKHNHVGRLLEKRFRNTSDAERMIRTLYELRRRSDYDKPRLEDKYTSLEEVRRGAITELRQATPLFDLAYYEVQQHLRG